MLSDERESLTGLHNVAKHVVHLQEGSDAILLTLRKLSAYHDSLRANASDGTKRRMDNTARSLISGRDRM